jgi:hypothetical protein
VALAGETGHLFTVAAGAAADTGQGMLAATSPSITGNFGYDVAFEANTGFLHLHDSSSPGVSRNLNLSMASGTSPSVTRVALVELVLRRLLGVSCANNP